MFRLREFLSRWVIVALVLMSTVAACAPTSPPAAEKLAPVGTQVVLRVGTGDSGAGLKPHEQIISEFQKANPDIKILLEPVDSRDYYATLLAQIDAGTAPDIMQIGDDAVPMFVRRGAFVNLAPFIKGNEPLDEGTYLPGVFQPGAWEGKQYFLPKDFSPLAVYYNKKLFDAYHVPYPRDGWTWEDFLKTAQALTLDVPFDPHGKLWGVQLPGVWTGGLEYWVAAEGGSLVGEDGRSIQGYMDSPESIAALKFYAGLYNTYKVAPPPPNLAAFGGGNIQFETGQAAMLISGHWLESEFKGNAAIDLGVVGMPAGDKRANVLFWSGFGIYSGSRNQAAAWRLLRFYAGEEGAKVWKNWGLPSVRSVAQSSGMTSDPIESVWLRELNYLVPRAYVFTPYWNETADPALQKAIEKAIADPKANVGTLLSEAARQAQAALQEKN